MMTQLKASIQRWWGPILFGFCILLAWEIGVRVFQIRAVLLPSPLQVFEALAENTDMIYNHIWPTTWQCIVGFIIAVVAGISLGIVVVYSRFFRRCVLPYVVAFQVLPKIALAPLFVIWFGVGSISRLAMTFFISFFPMVINTATGLETTERNLVWMARAFGGSKWQIFRTVQLPNALPFIFSGMKVSITLAVIGIIVGEFVASQEGLGFLIIFTQGMMDTPMMLATLFVLGCIGFAFYGVILGLERLVIFWRPQQEESQGEATRA